MQTRVQLDSLGDSARALARVAGDLADARSQLAVVHAHSSALGRAGAAAADQTWRTADRALGGVSSSITSLSEALRLLARVYDEVDRGAVR